MTKKQTGDAAGVLLKAPRVIEAVYEIPAQAHATMEPMNCTAHVTVDKCELWAPTHEIRASLGANGLPEAMAHRVVSPSHLLYVFPRTKMKADGPWDAPMAPPR